MAQTASTAFPKTLAGFGYGFNKEGILKKLDERTGKLTDECFNFNIGKDADHNQKHYEALGEIITEHVYKLLEDKGLKRIQIPEGTSEKEASFFFSTSAHLKSPKKLLVLIHGSGVVRAGQWSRSLIINHSLDSGSVLPFIDKGMSQGYEIVVTNTNDNYWYDLSTSGKRIRKPKLDSSTPTEHAASVWKKHVIDSQPESVFVVAHSYGGVVTCDLAEKFPEFFSDKVAAIAFTDSVHSIRKLSPKTKEIMHKITRNWTASNKKLNTLLSAGQDDFDCYSAGNIKHEWTSYSSMPALFEFFDKQMQSDDSKQN